SAGRRQKHKTSSWQLLSDWQHNWPMLVIAALSLGIIALVLGHDSVHCVARNPIGELRHWHATFICIQTG
ncbi:MAG TPA: hypothetical protein VII55_01810, partial [Candidatus Saccharimonadales bacterium]